MDPLYLRKLRINQPLNTDSTKNAASEFQSADKKPENKQNTNLNTQSQQIMENMREEILTPKQLKMNYLAGMERADYVKKTMNLPKTLPELLIQLQNPNLGKILNNSQMNTIPQPDTQQTEQSNPDGQNNNNKELANTTQNTQKGFSETLKNESERKQAVLRQYDRVLNTETHQDSAQRQVKEMQLNDNARFNLGIRQDKLYDAKQNANIIQNYVVGSQSGSNTFNINNTGQMSNNMQRLNSRASQTSEQNFRGVHDELYKTEQAKTAAAANLYTNLSLNDINNPTITQMRQRLSDDAFELLFTGLINLNELSETLKSNGQDARSKLILAMANASRQGIDNSQLASAMKMINSSLITDENNPASILKNIILLYLPWYPLQEGVGFNLFIETMANNSDFSSLLKVFIQTRNYGNVNGSLVLLSGNVVDMQIQCSDTFPEDDLINRMKDVTDNHSIQSNISVEQQTQLYDAAAAQQAKVNLSAVYELNPFLLLMAHSFIKNTIIIDSAANV